MNKLSSIVSVFVLGLAIIVLGAAIGMLYTGSFQIAILSGNEYVPEESTYADCSYFNKMTAGIIVSNAVGEVLNVVGNKITISKNNDTMTFNIRNNTPIMVLQPTTQTSSQIKIGDIKIGDSVSIGLKFLANGAWEPVSVLVAHKK